MREKRFYLNTDNYLIKKSASLVIQNEKGFSVFVIDESGRVLDQSFHKEDPNLPEDINSIDVVTGEILSTMECLTIKIPLDEILGKILFIKGIVNDHGFKPKDMSFQIGNILMDISSSLKKEEYLDEDLNISNSFDEMLESYFYNRSEPYKDHEREYLGFELDKVYKVFSQTREF